MLKFAISDKRGMLDVYTSGATTGARPKISNQKSQVAILKCVLGHWSWTQEVGMGLKFKFLWYDYGYFKATIAFQ